MLNKEYYYDKKSRKLKIQLHCPQGPTKLKQLCKQMKQVILVKGILFHFEII